MVPIPCRRKFEENKGAIHMLQIRTAEPQDLGRIMEIYHYAQDFMVQTGNPTQWRHAHPAEEMIRADINQKICKVLYDENGIHGVFALLEGRDPTYARIDGGSWRNDGPYVTIHRVAGDGQVHGLFSCIADYCKAISDNIRIDTHADNKIMQKQIERNGFQKCGIIYLENGDPRIAYQWTNEQ